MDTVETVQAQLAPASSPETGEVDTEERLAAALARAAAAWERGDLPAAVAAWRIVAGIDPSRLPAFPPRSRGALLVDAARYPPLPLPASPPTEVVHFDPGVDDVDTSTPGTRDALAWVYTPTLSPPLPPRVPTGRAFLLTGAASCVLASGGTYARAAREAAVYFDADTQHADLPEARETTNRLVVLSAALATAGLGLGVAAVVPW